MRPIVTFDSSAGPLNAEGLPEGRTDYFGELPKTPQRWRIEFEAIQADLSIVANDELAPPMKMPLKQLVHGYVLPRLDHLIAHVRKQTNIFIGWERTESMFVITAKFKIYRWR